MGIVLADELNEPAQEGLSVRPLYAVCVPTCRQIYRMLYLVCVCLPIPMCDMRRETAMILLSDTYDIEVVIEQALVVRSNV